MLKNQKQRKKSKKQNFQNHKLSEKSNFKSGSIVMTLKNVLLKTLQKINNLGGLPKKEEHIRIITRKAINSFDFILAILAEEHEIEELIIAFYRIGKKTANELKELQKKGKIKKITFLINDGFPKLVPDAYNVIKGYESKNWTIKLENNHTKIILAKSKRNYFVIEGSGNLSINARIEQYCFDNNKKIFDFHKDWITKI